MSRLVREVQAFFRAATLVGATAILAFLAAGVWILVFYGARHLLAAAAVYGACGIVAYVYLRQVRMRDGPDIGAVITGILAWPFFVILDIYDVMQWGGAPPRFPVKLISGLQAQELGSFRRWGEAVNCARQKAKDLGVKVWIWDNARRWIYSVDPAGRIERDRF